MTRFILRTWQNMITFFNSSKRNPRLEKKVPSNSLAGQVTKSWTKVRKKWPCPKQPIKCWCKCLHSAVGKKNDNITPIWNTVNRKCESIYPFIHKPRLGCIEKMQIFNNLSFISHALFVSPSLIYCWPSSLILWKKKNSQTKVMVAESLHLGGVTALQGEGTYRPWKYVIH